MIPRRGFFGKLAALVGLSSLPVQASKESAERKLRREKMAAKGLGPDDVRFEVVVDELNGIPQMRCYVDCWGETYGMSCGLHEGTGSLAVLINPDGTLQAVPRSPRESEPNS